MANDQDFILKNALEVGKDTKVTLGTITSGTVGLGTGNYFAQTLAGNTTYTFSNPGAVQSFQMEITGASAAAPYQIASSSYTSKSYAQAQTTDLQDVFFSTDGTKMYGLGGNLSGTRVYQYTLSTPWDVSTATYASKSFNFGSQNGDTRGIYIRSDGLRLFMVAGGVDTVYQYNLSTAWDVATMSYASKSFVVDTQANNTGSLSFKSDGTKMYVADGDNDRIFQYSLGTAWDVATASYDSVFLDIGAADPTLRGFYFSDNGLYLFVVGESNVRIGMYTLGTAWTLSTATLTGTFSVATQDTAPSGIYVKSDGMVMYVSGDSTDDIFQYNLSAVLQYTITWPASVEWPFGGMAPDAPAAGETDIYTFVTDDGGTSYIGLLTADAV